MVFLWVRKYHADSIHRVVYTVDLQKARHPADEDQVRAELLCGNYFMLRKENQIARLWNGHELSWQAFTPELQTLLLGKKRAGIITTVSRLYANALAGDHDGTHDRHTSDVGNGRRYHLGKSGHALLLA